VTTPPAPPPHGTPPGGQPPAPGWGQPSPPPGFPAQPRAHPVQPGPPQGYPPAYQGPGQAYPQHPGYAQQAGHPQAGHPQPGYPPQPGHAQQPGYPPPAGPPGFPGQPQGFPPPAAKKTSSGAKALIAVVVLGIAGIVVAGFVAGADSPGRAAVGDCVKVESASASRADVATVDCGSPEAAFRVAVNLDRSTAACPSGDYSEYSSRGGRRSNGFKLCLVYNAREGDCFKQEGTIVAGKTTKVTCDSSATHKVTKVASVEDENACEGGETVFVYSQPATTICMVKTE